MKIEYNSNPIKVFENLSVGDVYEEGGSIFMKTEEAVIDDDKVNCVDLSCGEMFCSRDDAPVEVKHAKVVIE